MTTHIMPHPSREISIIDEMDISVVRKTIDKIATFQAIVQKTLKKDHDYGVIPGTLKPTLLKPGGEKICMMLGVSPEYEMMDRVQDYEKGTKHVSQGLGNCNSFEKKYRWINSDYIPEGIHREQARQFIDKYGRLRFKIPNQDPCDLRFSRFYSYGTTHRNGIYRSRRTTQMPQRLRAL